jgi:L-alanine-DL-glutamate epimerase-like enolase superfamily enzyme
MKIAAVTVDLLSVPLDRPYRAGGRQIISANWHVLAQVTTTDGVQGFGYVVALQQTFVKAVAAATRELGAHLIGMHVMEVGGGMGPDGARG